MNKLYKSWHKSTVTSDTPSDTNKLQLKLSPVIFYHNFLFFFAIRLEGPCSTARLFIYLKMLKVQRLIALDFYSVHVASQVLSPMLLFISKAL